MADDEVAVTVRADVGEFTQAMGRVNSNLDDVAERAGRSFPEKRKRAFDSREVQDFGRQLSKANAEYERMERTQRRAGGFGSSFRGGVVGGAVGAMVAEAEGNALAPFTQLAGLFGNSAVVALAPVLGKLAEVLASPAFQRVLGGAADFASTAAEGMEGKESESILGPTGLAIGTKIAGPVGGVVGGAVGAVLGAGFDEAGQRPDAAVGAGIGGGLGRLVGLVPGAQFFDDPLREIGAEMGAWLQRDVFGDPDVGDPVGARERASIPGSGT